MIKKSYLFFATIMLSTVAIFLSNCVRGDDVAGTTETGNPDAKAALISGHLYNMDGTPAQDAKVKFILYDHSPVTLSKKHGPIEQTVTDENGYYSLDYLAQDVYNVIGEDNQGNLSFLDSVPVGKDTVKLPNDTLKPAGAIKGISFMAGQNDTNMIRVTIYIPGTNYLKKPDIGGVFKFNNVPEGNFRLIFDPTLNEYSVKIMDIAVSAGDTLDLDTVFLYSTNITGLPLANAGQDTTVSVKDTVYLYGSGSDPFGSVVDLAWQIGANDTFKTTVTGNDTFAAPALEDTAFQCVFRVTDNDQNKSYDTVRVYVLQDVPVPDAGPVVFADSGEQVVLAGQATDEYGSIVKWEWAVGEPYDFIANPAGICTVNAQARPMDSLLCILRVTDDDSNTAMDTAVIYVGFNVHHVLWYNVVTNAYPVTESNPGPGLSPAAVIHEGMIATASLSQHSGAASPDFSIGSGPDDMQGRCAFVWSRDLEIATGNVNLAKFRAEYRNGLCGDDPACNAGPINIRCGVVDFQGNLDTWGGANQVPTTADWQDFLNPMSSSMGYDYMTPTLEAEEIIPIVAPGTTDSTGPDPMLDGEFFEIDITDQVNWIMAHTGANKGTFSGHYAIVFLVAPEKGSTGKISTYSFEDTPGMSLIQCGSDNPWTTDGNTAHIVLEGIIEF